ncbi:alpha-hydroxy acid oxidase [Hyphomonas johnsonii]|jgi:L-lactate dehydrogenase (cytochrome)|uniref:(S)-2-hydroxy-acid oxidase n=1 Tax=Hyphomonas johnsonii MHS-2 TaxID=1280950 RepID=A0A059FG45_9PROT|nr:alpha-hydroxy acid oxidase [Hyphomonas johnsonii]KCZ89488.1 (S)-2-hydroxy-acid oxidase [Hyphomonas johnsonii MHS-2]
MAGAASAINISDLRELAKRRLPRMVFDYIDGGAEDEMTLRRSVDRFDDFEWVWNSLVDVSEINTATRVMGQPNAQPFFVSPTAASCLFHPRAGELATGRAANAAGVAYSISTLASKSLEDIAAAAPDVPKFIQVYVWKDRGLVKDFLARAKAAGFTGCILTVDAVIAGNRERDPRNGFSIPPSVNWKTATQALARPGYLMDLARSPAIAPANFEGVDTGGRDVMGVINELFDRTMTWKDAEWMAQEWGGPFAIKGISTAEDARRALDAGASTVWLSNHGGRQIDTSVPVIDLLPEVRAAVGAGVEVIADGGVRRGSHVLKLIARGASSVALGRACLYGLAAGGEAGVTRALDIMASDVERLLGLLGIPDVSQLDERLLRPRAG